MALFFKDGKVKSTLFITAFSLSLCYAAVYIFCYIISAGLVAALAPFETGSFLQKWLPPSLISIAGTLPCLIPLFILKDKKTALLAFVLLGLYGLCFIVFIMTQFRGRDQAVFLNLALIYLAAPAFWGNALAFACYGLFLRKKQ
ncbi:MAG: hypothetical protein LBH73_04745 [Spirochaetaceae bacterium]|jgi:hypothetical protein|nr:hypothetical protein [Spirochaetaceae bacterium]